MEFTVSQIAQMINGQVQGDGDQKVNSVAKIEEGKAGDISFLANLKYEPFIYTTDSTAVIVDKTFVPSKSIKATLIQVDNAYLAFTALLEEYQKIIANSKVGREQPHFIGEGVTIGESEYIGAFAYIGKNSKLGKNVQIYPNTYIGENVTIGDGTIIHPGAKIYNDTVIGQRCVIFANAVIGGDGFGFAPQFDGSYKRIPQLGNVVIEDDVSIGSNTTIDCATMGSTIIRQGTKLDNLVQIAHNVEIGKNTVIAAQSGVSGSTRVGDQCVIAGQVGVVGHISIANGTKVGAQSGISKTIKKEGLSFSGSPAMELTANLKTISMMRRLPDLEKRIKELEEAK